MYFTGVVCGEAETVSLVAKELVVVMVIATGVLLSGGDFSFAAVRGADTTEIVMENLHKHRNEINKTFLCVDKCSLIKADK